MFVPSFKFNFLSKHKLCLQFGCDLIFSAFWCSLQGPLLKRLPGLGRIKNNLNILRSMHSLPENSPRKLSTISNVSITLHNSASCFPIHSMSTSVNTSQNVWHVILGHMLSSMKNISCLTLDALNKDILPCTIFLMARQHKLPFLSV